MPIALPQTEIHLYQRSISLLPSKSLATPLAFSKTCETHLVEILSAYLNTNSTPLAIHRTRNGKPFLPDHPWLSFSLSHTQETLLVALAHTRRLGVDIESLTRPHPERLREKIIRRFFGASENIQYTESKDQVRTFYELWIEKEAYIKAIGSRWFSPIDPESDSSSLSWVRQPLAFDAWNKSTQVPLIGSLVYEHIERADTLEISGRRGSPCVTCYF